LAQRPLTGAVAIDYRGTRSILGRTVDGYALWDPTVGGPPIRTFPLTAEGWEEAWNAFRHLEAASAAPGAIPSLRLTQLMGVAFSVYRRHLRVLATIAGILVLPAYALSLGLILATVRLVPERVGLETVMAPRIPLWVDITNNVLLYAIVIPFLTGAMVTAVVWAMLGRTPSIRSAYRRAAGRAHSLLWVSLLAAVAASAPLVPGVLAAGRVDGSGIDVAVAVVLVSAGLVAGAFLATRFLFGTSVVVVEGVRGIEALRRSWRLVRGLTGRVLGGLLLALLFLFGVLIVSVTVALTAVLFRELTEETVRFVLIVVTVVSAFVVAVAGPVVNVVVVLLYLDARGRKDGLTLAELDDEIGGRG
jgi:hypothetical protein